MRNLEASASAIKAEEDRLRDRRKALEKCKAAWLKRVGLESLQHMQRLRRGALFTLAVQNNPPSGRGGLFAGQAAHLSASSPKCRGPTRSAIGKRSKRVK